MQVWDGFVTEHTMYPDGEEQILPSKSFHSCVNKSTNFQKSPKVNFLFQWSIRYQKRVQNHCIRNIFHKDERTLLKSKTLRGGCEDWRGEESSVGVPPLLGQERLQSHSVFAIVSASHIIVCRRQKRKCNCCGPAWTVLGKCWCLNQLKFLQKSAHPINICLAKSSQCISANHLTSGSK